MLKFDHKEQPKGGKLSLVLATYFAAIFVALLDASAHYSGGYLHVAANLVGLTLTYQYRTKYISWFFFIADIGRTRGWQSDDVRKYWLEELPLAIPTIVIVHSTVRLSTEIADYELSPLYAFKVVLLLWLIFILLAEGVRRNRM